MRGDGRRSRRQAPAGIAKPIAQRTDLGAVGLVVRLKLGDAGQKRRPDRVHDFPCTVNLRAERLVWHCGSINMANAKNVCVGPVAPTDVQRHLAAILAHPNTAFSTSGGSHPSGFCTFPISFRTTPSATLAMFLRCTSVHTRSSGMPS